jgi:peptidoglycan/LPS O-acetylase OafA/YrhL
VSAFWIEEPGVISVTSAVWQFPLIALGMAALLVCAVSPRLPFHRIKVPGAAFIASIAYSAYLVQKLVIHFVAEYCLPRLNEVAAGTTPHIEPTSWWALIGVQVCIYAAATILFFAVERPFLLLRHRIAGRPVRS